MKQLTLDIRQVAREAGADLIGFAPMSRFQDAPRAVNPRTIYPPTKTAIAVAIRHERGALRAVEEGTYWQAYNCDNYWWLNEVMAPMLLRKIILRLEEAGYDGVPIHNPFHPHSGRQVREDFPDGPDGMMSMRVVGCAAGLGELGLSKIFLTPEFGPRQRVFAVLTNAELEATPLLQESVCDLCGECAKECEAGAIPRKPDVSFQIEGRTFRHGTLDCARCVTVHRGSDKRFVPFWNGSEPQDATHPSYGEWSLNRFRHLSYCAGRGCIRACLDHLEKTGRIKSRFVQPMIDQPRWKLDGAP